MQLNKSPYIALKQNRSHKYFISVSRDDYVVADENQSAMGLFNTLQKSYKVFIHREAFNNNNFTALLNRA